MENLDNKYFETVIMALKKAKANQKIEIRPDFKAKLRAQIVQQSLSMQVDEKTDWADWILRYKYVFGGVPVLAVLTLVAVSALNFQIKLPKSEIVPVAGPVSEKALLQSDQSDASDRAVTTVLPRIKTFSSELVMPPAEYLQNRGETTDSTQTSDENAGPGSQVTSTDYMFLDGINVQLQTFVPQTKSQPKSTPVENEQPQLLNEFIVEWFVPDTINEREPAANIADNGEKLTPDATTRQEQSGRLEQSGQVSTPSATDQSVETVDTTVQPTNLQTTGQTQPAPTLPPEVLTESEGYINPVEEQNQIIPKTTIQYRALDVITPHFLSADRINFEDTNRAAVVDAVLRGLSSRNGNLSNDYYVNVTLVENGTYKATLYEFGQVKQILILAERDGRFSVVTELVY